LTKKFLEMSSNIVKVMKLGTVRYQTAWQLQKKLVEQVHLKSRGHTLLLLEHPPVYTTGIRTGEYSEEEEHRLIDLGADFVRTNRGGLITFHGPGQLVVYPILNLKEFAPEVAARKALLGMKWYIHNLEQLIIDLCQDYGISANRSPHTGVWVGNNKICAMGVHNSKLVTSHGLALNCNTDLDWFSHIVPCGIQGAGVTSLTRETGNVITCPQVEKLMLSKFSEAFNCEIREEGFDVSQIIED